MFKEEENEEDLGGQGTLCHAVISRDGKFIITAKDAYKTMENIRQEVRTRKRLSNCSV